MPFVSNFISDRFHSHLIIFQFATAAIMKGGNGDIKRMQLYDKPAEPEEAVVETVATPAEKSKKV